MINNSSHAPGSTARSSTSTRSSLFPLILFKLFWPTYTVCPRYECDRDALLAFCVSALHCVILLLWFSSQPRAQALCTCHGGRLPDLSSARTDRILQNSSVPWGKLGCSVSARPGFGRQSSPIATVVIVITVLTRPHC